jgi:hypothetical protein
MGLAEDPASKRLKLPPYVGGAAAAAAKKANHEQWETMFARLVECKEAYGVSLLSVLAALDQRNVSIGFMYSFSFLFSLTGLPCSQAIRC